jgi:hypothetical protein
MNPLISLGPYEAPDFDLLHEDLYPILASLIERSEPLSEETWNALLCWLQLDTVFLADDTRNFFLKFEDACRRIASEEVTSYNPSWTQTHDIEWNLRRFPNDGVVTTGAKTAAQGYLDFLAAHPDWRPSP